MSTILNLNQLQGCDVRSAERVGRLIDRSLSGSEVLNPLPGGAATEEYRSSTSGTGTILPSYVLEIE